MLELPTITRRHLSRHRQLILQADGVEEIIYSPKIWRSDSYYIIAEMVADNLGWARLPVNIGQYQAYRKPLKQLLCPVVYLPALQVRTVWNSGRQLSAVLIWIQKIFSELLKHPVETAQT